MSSMKELMAELKNTEKSIPEMDLEPERKLLIAELAKRFDQGVAFPNLSDVRNFLLERGQATTGLKGRVDAFRRMLPILSAMSPKGLRNLIAQSHHSGPSDLASISDAIQRAAKDLREK